MQKETDAVTGVPVVVTAPTQTVPVPPVRHPPAAGFHAPDATGIPAATHNEVPAPAKPTVNDHDEAAVLTPVMAIGPAQPNAEADPAPANWPNPAGAAGAACMPDVVTAAASAVAARNLSIRDTSVVPWCPRSKSAVRCVSPRNASSSFWASRPFSCGLVFFLVLDPALGR